METISRTTELVRPGRMPGRFTEEVLHRLGEASQELGVIVEEIDLGDDPSLEELEVTVRAAQGDEDGPELFFTFSSEGSVDENFDDFRDFVKEHAGVAALPPTQQEQRGTAASIASARAKFVTQPRESNPG